MSWFFQSASDAGGYAYSSRIASPVFWACIWLVVAFCAIHAIRRARSNPAQKPAANYNLNQKLYHWGNFGLLALLAVSGFYLFFRRAPVSPQGTLGITWLTLHEWTGLLFAAGVIAHALAALTRGDWRSMRPEWKDATNTFLIWRNFLGRTANYPFPGKYDALQKLYHHILALLAVSFTVSGTLMWLSGSRTFLSSRGWIHLSRQVHDLSAVALVVMVIAHIYFSILKVNRENLKDMTGLRREISKAEAAD
jgi:formate dehydrogenase gamma subunit